MKKNNYISFTVITILIGFMFAIQFQTTNHNEVRDTRDIWELRKDYLKAKELETKLLQEIRTNEEKLAKYKSELQFGKEQTLLETLEELRAEAGLSESVGPGIIIKLQPIIIYQNHDPFQVQVTPDVLRRLVNELNLYGAKEISIANQRVVNTTVIREIQGETKIDGFPLRNFPIEIKVIAEDFESAEKLYNRMQISTIPDEFFIDNLQVFISEPKKEITIPPYTNHIKVKYMKTVREERD